MHGEGQNAVLHRTVGELVAEDYRRAAVFTALGIDFCCGGRRTVAQACAAAGVDPQRLAEALQEADARKGERGPSAPESWSLGQLVRHIEAEHHTYVRRVLPVLDSWTDKVARVHGGRHPELVEVRQLFTELAAELLRHLGDEEESLFPLLASLDDAEGGDAVGSGLPASVLEGLEDDHDHAGSVVRRMRELTNGFSPPEGACATYRATFALLAEFEGDLHRHVHLENNVLFPRAREAVRGGGSPT